MAQLSTYGAKYFINCLFGKSQTPYSTFYLGLSTAPIYEYNNGSGISEPSAANGYARQSYVNSYSGALATIIAKKIESSVATVITQASHGYVAGQRISVSVNDPQFDKTGKSTSYWTTDATEVVAAPTTTSFTYACVAANVGGAITSLTRSSNVVTVVTSAAHNLSIGQTIYITNTTSGTFNGIYKIQSSSSASNFTYSQVGANETESSSPGFVYVSTSGSAKPFVNIVGARQVSSASAFLFTDTSSLLSAGDYVSISSGSNSSVDTFRTTQLPNLAIGNDYIDDSRQVLSANNSLNIVSYANSTFEGTHGWTATGGTTSTVSKSVAGETNYFQAVRASGTTNLVFTSDYVIGITAGSRYAIGLDYQASLAGATGTVLTVSWYPSSGSTPITGSPVTVKAQTGTTTGWSTLYETLVAPALATRAKITFTHVSATGANTVKIRKPIIALTPEAPTITQSGGTIPTHFRISAITPSGETPPGAFVQASILTTGTVSYTIPTVYSGATAYRIYAYVGNIENSVINNAYLKPQLVTTVTATSGTFAASLVPSTGFSKTWSAFWYPGGYTAGITSVVSDSIRDGVYSDTRFSPASNGAFGYASKLANWITESDGHVFNGSNILFGPCTTSDWGTLVSWFISDSQYGGNVIAYGTLYDKINISVGDTFSFGYGSISFKLFSGY